MIGGHGAVRERIDLARVALEELLRREAVGQLPEPFRNELVELGLAVQKSVPDLTPVQYDLLDYLSNRVVAGDLSDDQKTRFYQAATSSNLAVRAIVIDGDQVPTRFWATE